MRILFISLTVFWVWFGSGMSALAKERITTFDVEIQVEKNGDILVTETIDVIAEGIHIRRGIYRDLPRFFSLDGEKIPYRYTVVSVQRDGKKETFKRQKLGNAYRIRIGDADTYLSSGPHRYRINYKVKNQIRYFKDYDELYWNATGSYWTFPIDKAVVRVRLPEGATYAGQSAYTGILGSRSQNYVFRETNGELIFETSRALGVNEGITISLSLPKGGIDPPSAADLRALWWAKNAATFFFVTTLLGVFAFYYSKWSRYGRDPQMGPLFARYEPPKNYSPAAVSFIHYKSIRGHKALTATLIALATKGWIDID
ncbi:MAG TPA: DUF2207 domain-containing protein, partial [Hellea balneolensis]|nr:DUF2207 domain-containing protein [Hellea balneolensis]